MRDQYGRAITYLRLSVTDLCNLRCRYCMPEEGVCKKNHEEILSEDEMILAVRAAASLGISKVRITGGEPLLKENILSICRRTAAVEGIQEVCLTTNGILLPPLAKALREAGVNRVNLSLDTLHGGRYAYLTRRELLDRALAGLQAALETGFDQVKINAVLMGGYNDEDIVPLAELTKRYPVDVRFIELMPMQDNEFGAEAFVPCDTVLDRLPEAVLQESEEGVARLYRLPNAPGRIGLISPLSNHFCAACKRIRLTADGKIKPCLHSADEYAVKGLDFEGMRQQMERAVLNKPVWHGDLSAESRSGAGRNMNQIGG